MIYCPSAVELFSHTINNFAMTFYQKLVYLVTKETTVSGKSKIKYEMRCVKKTKENLNRIFYLS